MSYFVCIAMVNYENFVSYKCSRMARACSRSFNHFLVHLIPPKIRRSKKWSNAYVRVALVGHCPNWEAAYRNCTPNRRGNIAATRV